MTEVIVGIVLGLVLPVGLIIAGKFLRKGLERLMLKLILDFLSGK